MSIRFPSEVFPTLSTGRLLLREISFADNGRLLAIRSNADVNRFTGRSCDQTIAGIDEFIAARKEDRINGAGVYWGIEMDNALIGTICLWNFDDATASTEIGYELLPTAQGKGLMAEAISKVIAYAFDEMCLKVITAWLVAENERSVRLLERHQFQYSETMDGYLVYKLDNTAWRSTIP